MGAAYSQAAPTVRQSDYAYLSPDPVEEPSRVPKRVLRAPKMVDRSDEDGMSAPVCCLDGDAPRSCARVVVLPDEVSLRSQTGIGVI